MTYAACFPVVFGLAIYSGILLIALQEQQSQLSSKNQFFLLIQQMTTAIQSLVAFLLAGFVVKVVNEWRVQRVTYGTLIGKARSFTIMACAFVQVSRGAA